MKMLRLQHMCNLFIGAGASASVFAGGAGSAARVVRAARGADALVLLGNIGAPTSPLTYLAFRAWSSEWPRVLWVPGPFEQVEGYEKGLDLCKRCVAGLPRVRVLDGVQNRYTTLKGVTLVGIPSAATRLIAEEDNEMLMSDIERMSESRGLVICSGDSLSQFARDEIPGDSVKGWLSGGTDVCSGMISDSCFWAQNPYQQMKGGPLNHYWRADSTLTVPLGAKV